MSDTKKPDQPPKKDSKKEEKKEEELVSFSNIILSRAKRTQS